MKTNYLLLILFLPLFIYSQDVIWEKSYGEIHADYLFDTQPTANYGFVSGGSSMFNKIGNKTNHNPGDLMIGSGNKRKRDIVGNDLKKQQPL